MNRMLRSASASLLVCSGTVLIGFAPLAASGDTPKPSVPINAPSEAGAPVAITNVAGYVNSTKRGALTLSNVHLYCVSFRNVGERVLRAVTIELTHRRLDNSVSEVKTIERYGSFAPGVEIRGYQGESVGIPDGHAMANCVPFSMVLPGIGDAPFTVVRPIAATYEDGTTWVSATGASTVPTPVPVAADDVAPPVWDAAHHTGYLAVESGGGTFGKPAPQIISLFAPGRRTPSAILTFPKCCVMAMAFAPSGDLLVATMGLHEGLLVFAPGATAPTKSFADHDGFALAVDDAGDLAIGGFNSGPDTAVYPSGGAAYRISGQPVPGGLAFAPNGELALADYKSGNVRIYPRGASVPAREFPLSSVATPGGLYIVGSLKYDRAGDLAVYDLRGGRVRVYPPGSDQPAYTVPAGNASGVAFDGSGNLVVSTNLATFVYAPHAVTPTKTIVHGGSALAVDARGGFVLADPFRNELVVVDADGRQTVVPGFDRPGDLIISP